VTIEGELTIRLAWDGKRVGDVAVRSTRPFMASRLFAGRTPEEAVTLAPLLYSVCAHAQGVAAAGALEAATGGAPAAATVSARRQEVILETVQEYLWRILIDWPLAMGHPGDVQPVASARRLIAPTLDTLARVARRIDGRPSPGCDVRPVAGALAELAATHLYGVAPDLWLARTDVDAIAVWARGRQTLPARLLDDLLQESPGLARSDVALMPVAQREALAAAVVPALRSDPDFEQAPSWSGAAVETGALARSGTHPYVAAIRGRSGNAVPARFAARLTELALLLGELAGVARDQDRAPWSDAFALGAGEGLGVVQTARGLLLHYARVDAGRVGAYRIVAPTEWNFRPSGALVRGLGTLAANDESRLLRDARIAVQALDPCVACRIEVAHA